MAKNRVQNGDRITVTLTGTVASGDPIRIGDMLGVCLTDGVSGDDIACAVSQVHNLPKLSTETYTQGDVLHFDASAEGGTVTAVTLTPASGDVADFGIAWEASSAGAGNIAVKLVNGTNAVGTA